MNVETVPEIELIESLDFEEAKTCESTKGCPREAVVLVVHNCCGGSQRLCHEHLNGLRDLFNRAAKWHLRITCNRCGVEATFPTIVPLNGGA